MIRWMAYIEHYNAVENPNDSFSNVATRIFGFRGSTDCSIRIMKGRGDIIYRNLHDDQLHSLEWKGSLHDGA